MKFLVLFAVVILQAIASPTSDLSERIARRVERVREFPLKVVGHVRDHVQEHVNQVRGRFRGEKAVEANAPVLATEGQSELLQHLTEMQRRGNFMSETINKYYDDQRSSLLLTENEKKIAAAEQEDFNTFHTEMMAKMNASKDIESINQARDAYLPKALSIFKQVTKKNEEMACKPEYNEEEAEIVEKFPEISSLAGEMERRAGVMMALFEKHYNGIQAKETSTAAEKQEAKEKLAATKVYHNDMMAKMAKGSDMKETMCLRHEYLVELLALFDQIKNSQQ